MGALQQKSEVIRQTFGGSEFPWGTSLSCNGVIKRWEQI